MEVLNRVSDAPPWSTLLSWSMRRHRISAVRPASRDPRRAVRSAAVLFAVIGVLFGSWASVIPAVSARVQADHAQLGVALLGMAIGALAGMQVGGRSSSRWGPGRAGVTGVALASLAVALPGAAGSLMSLCIALFLFGAAAGGANVAVNALGVELQRSSGRPLMSMLHAGFSFGGLAGASLGGLAAGALPPSAHLLLIGGAGLAFTCAQHRTLAAFTAKAVPEPLPGSGERAAPVPPPSPLVLVLGAVAACTAVAEGAVSDWGSLHLRETLGSSPGTAAMGFAVFSLAMGSARLVGRRLVSRFGDTRVLIRGAALGTAGMLIAALAPTPPIALVGFLLAGAGTANVFPLAIGRAGLLGGTRGVARASTVGYAGLLGGPPIVGALAEAWGLRGALLAVAAVVLSVGGLAAAVDAALRTGRRSVAKAPLLGTRARLGALARAGERSLRAHADSLRALVEETERSIGGGPRPISGTFAR